MDCSGDGGLGGVPVSVSATTSLAAVVTTDQEKWYGSGIFKQEISGANAEGGLRGLKVAKTAALDDISAPKAMQRSSLLRSNSYFDGHGQQMLCFSSPNSQTVTFPFCHPSSNAYTQNEAYGSGGLNIGRMQGSKGLFTPSQWMELEHQALIYKYITAKVPIPSSLLTPIRKALDSAGFSSFLGLKPDGWSALHLGFSNSTDPEPGRCRRTDGKKWRCSKDAMVDHKYCERHMNRGRHRSRKPVEGQAGHPVSGTTNNNIKAMPPVASSKPAAGIPAGGASNSLGLTTCQQLNNAQSGVASQSSASGLGNRNFLDKENLGRSLQDVTGLSMISPAVSLKENQYSVTSQHEAYHGSSGGEFGQVCSDSLLNPFDKCSSLVGCSSYGKSEDRKDMISRPNNGLHEFFVEWPNNSQSERLKRDIAMHTERTRLSISIPMTASDFMSSTSSPTNERAGLSPSKCPQGLESAKAGLQVGNISNERNLREASWNPITWESLVGGPLGEVLHSTNNSSDERKIPSGLNLTTGWDGSQSLVTSPTGILQKAAFVSLSNSSAGSSPRAENSKPHEGASLCSSVLAPSLTSPALPSL